MKGKGTVIKVYGTSGVKALTMFSSSCCQTSFLHSFIEEKKKINSKEVIIRKYNRVENSKYFHATRRTVFERRLLEQIYLETVIGKVDLTSSVEIYNRMHGLSLTVATLIQVFLSFLIAQRVPGKYIY